MTRTGKKAEAWVEIRLGELIEIIRGVSYIKDQASSEESSTLVPILRATNIHQILDFDDLVYVPTSCVSEGQYLKRGDIVIAASSGSKSVVGRAAQLRQDWHGSFGAFCMGIRTSPLVASAFIAWFLQTDEYRHQVSDLASGSNINNLRRDHIENLAFRLAPLPEQRRIVAKIEELFSELDAGVAALERVRANLKRYRAAVLKAAVEGKLTADWRARHPNTEPASVLLGRILTERREKWEKEQLANFTEAKKQTPREWREKYRQPVTPDRSGLPSTPKSWEWTSLEAITLIVGGITKDQKKANKQGMRDVPYLRVANVQRGHLDLTELKTISATEAEISELRLQNGDVLFTEGGDRDKLGRGWIWTGELKECIHQNHIFRARPISEQISSRFLSHHGNTFGAEWFSKAGKQTTNLASINLGVLRRFPVPIPPAEEQTEITAIADERLSQIEASERAVETSLKRAARLRQAILKRAFEGRLVPQDPNDEPADKLLERIRRERQASSTSKNGEPATRKRGRARKTETAHPLFDEDDRTDEGGES